MRVLLDTSILVAALVEAHPMHERALPWLQRAKNREFEGLIAAHSLAEVYAILTSLPLQPRLSPAGAFKLIQLDLTNTLEVVGLGIEDYVSVLERASRHQLAGGAIYDALIAYAAVKGYADQLVTLNQRDFARVAPELSGRIITPS